MPKFEVFVKQVTVATSSKVVIAENADEAIDFVVSSAADNPGSFAWDHHIEAVDLVEWKHGDR